MRRCSSNDEHNHLPQLCERQVPTLHLVGELGQRFDHEVCRPDPASMKPTSLRLPSAARTIFRIVGESSTTRIVRMSSRREPGELEHGTIAGVTRRGTV